MENLLEYLIEEINGNSRGITEENFMGNIDYQTSFFVKVSSTRAKWYIKEIEMDESDQKQLLASLEELSKKHVEDYRLEDRDAEQVYKYETEGLLVNTLKIHDAFAGGIYSDEKNAHGDRDDTREIAIANLEGYPVNDEVHLIVHRLLVGGFILLAFCNQSYTSLAKVNIRTRLDNKLKSIEKNKYYRIRNDVSFLATLNHYYIRSVDYFERLFLIDNQIARKKQKALEALSESQLIVGFDSLNPELNKGYMARSVSMIDMSASEMKEYVKKHKDVISAFCREYEAGVRFDSRSTKFTITDGKIASLFLTHLFSNRMGRNIEGELVYFKTFGKLKKAASVTT